ncbi:MAG: polysaccharide deacetylase family protein [Phycisphaerae bacterium]|nr:polysaccharide deacetylase family protein [Phycisphaerae bacterium]
MRNSLPERLTCPRSPAGHCATRSCAILQYHRVALLSHDPLRLAVQPHHFERQMEYLATSCNVISLNELRQHLETATPWRDRTVAVTFDGGYSDVLYTAQEVLERFEIPATVFVPSVNLIRRTRFWWDDLEDVLLAGDSCGPLVVETDEESYCWPLTSQHDRFRAFDDLYGILSNQAPARQRELITGILRSLDGPGEELDSHATLTAQELPRLEEGGRITVGGYTHHGVKLSLLSEPEQRREIQYNKRMLEEVLGHEIECFAYPFGDEGSYTTATGRILRDSGFRLSCRVSPDPVSVTGADGLYELPRLTIRDWNPFTFHRYLEAFLD